MRRTGSSQPQVLLLFIPDTCQGHGGEIFSSTIISSQIPVPHRMTFSLIFHILHILISTVLVQICSTSFLYQILRGDMNSTTETLKNRSIINLHQDLAKVEMETSAEPSFPKPPVHRLDFLTLIIPFLCLFCLSVVIFVLNLFRASFSTFYSFSRPSYRHTPDINIIEPTRSFSGREVMNGH